MQINKSAHKKPSQNKQQKYKLIDQRLLWVNVLTTNQCCQIFFKFPAEMVPKN